MGQEYAYGNSLIRIWMDLEDYCEIRWNWNKITKERIINMVRYSAYIRILIDKKRITI